MVKMVGLGLGRCSGSARMRWGHTFTSSASTQKLGAETGGPGAHWPAGFSELLSFRFSERPCLKKMSWIVSDKTPTIGLQPLLMFPTPQTHTVHLILCILDHSWNREIKSARSNAARGSSDEMLTQHYRKADYLTKMQELWGGLNIHPQYHD